jgi:hypothetical protein
MKSIIYDWSKDSHTDWPAAVVVEDLEHHHHSEISRRRRDIVTIPS